MKKINENKSFIYFKTAYLRLDNIIVLVLKIYIFYDYNAYLEQGFLNKNRSIFNFFCLIVRYKHKKLLD